MHEPLGTERPDLLIAEHRGSQNDALGDLIGAVRISQDAMKLL